MTKIEEAFAQHGIQVECTRDGSVRMTRQEARDLLGYLELMHGELYKRGLCANGSPIMDGDHVEPFAIPPPA